jgi:predicted transcriptional regulator
MKGDLMSHKSAEYIEKFLHDHHLTISAFARMADISRLSVYKYLSGSRIHPKTAKKIEDNLLKNFRVFLPSEKLID